MGFYDFTIEKPDLKEELFRRLVKLAKRSRWSKALFPAATINGFVISAHYYIDRRHGVEEVVIDFPDYKVSVKKILRTSEICSRVEDKKIRLSLDNRYLLPAYTKDCDLMLSKVITVFDSYGPLLNLSYLVKKILRCYS